MRSNLGQPLQAEIDLIGITEQEGQHLAVRLASAEAYQRAGLTYNPIVSTLRASLVRRPAAATWCGYAPPSPSASRSSIFWST
nr:hypothetical protein [Ralstonia solanacearum]